MVTEILREFDFPAGFLQALCALLHERYPVSLVGQAEDALRRGAEGVQGVAGNLLQAAAGQRFEGFGFRLRAALQADGLAFRQGDEFALFLGADVGIPITEDDLGHVELTAAEILRIVAPGAVAVGVQGFQLQHRNERRIDQAQAVVRLCCPVAAGRGASSDSASATWAASVADSGGRENRRLTTSGLPVTSRGPASPSARSISRGGSTATIISADGSGFR